jgi:hypothetical protein
MKRLSVWLAVCLAVLATTSVFLLAAAAKVDLVPCPINWPNPASPPPGSAFVIFNNPSGEDGFNFQMLVSLKKVLPRTAYDVYYYVDDGNIPYLAGTVTTNIQGNANVHFKGSIPEGGHVMMACVTLHGSGSDIYETPGIHEDQGSYMMFK